MIIAVAVFFGAGGGLLLVSFGAFSVLTSVLGGAAAAGGAAGGQAASQDNGDIICDSDPSASQNNSSAVMTATVPGYGTYTVDSSQMMYAKIIIAVGKSKNINDKGLVISIMTALQESKLANLKGGDRDSVGLFQQRPSQGWGTVEQITGETDANGQKDYHGPKYAAGKFFSAMLGTHPPELTWEQYADQNGYGAEAQRIQRSGFPDAYDKWQSLASQIVGKAGGISCSEVAASASAAKVIAAGMQQLGLPYCWGGGDSTGPTNTSSNGGNGLDNRPPCDTHKGFDCSGLMIYVFAQVGIPLAHWTGDQIKAGTAVASMDDLQPGDMMFFSSNGTEAGVHHVGLYIGDDKMLHAPHHGATVEVVNNVKENSYYKTQFYQGTRVLPDSGSSASASSDAAPAKKMPYGSVADLPFAPATLDRSMSKGVA
ncbi:C40 family peptidase [Mangrovactinospora gilvigrisea]|uniref:C40 family peptidase n=1 Tax=Mangrovactinospora gilvigrisea TaxID=1428644 RepID=UPI001114B0DB|nr:C40 family peptidase [Mangrovactinospora gilvigrisea]